MKTREELAAKTIDDFGEQWTRFVDSPGYYGSSELFSDLIAPFLTPADFRGARVAEIGSGTGRIVRMLAEAGAAHITTVEPSKAIHRLKINTEDIAEKIRYVHDTGDRMPAEADLDFVVCFGILHHVPDPSPIVRRAYQALRPSGRIVVWVYGQEGTRLYLSLILPLRAITKNLPPGILAALCRILDVPLVLYMFACWYLRLPLWRYMRDHLSRLAPSVRRLTIYDQLNPAWAKYYTREEAEGLLLSVGFVNVKAHHRHGYSWTVLGERPADS